MTIDEQEQVRRICKGDLGYALFCKRPSTDSATFLTTPADDFQVGVMQRAAGYQVEAHTHPRHSRTLESVTEFLYVQQGAIRVRVFDEGWVALGDELLEQGDFVVLFRGGHSVSVLSDARLIEVKQGSGLDFSTSKVLRPSDDSGPCPN